VVAVNMANESWRTSTMMGWDEQNHIMAPASALNGSHVSTPLPAAIPTAAP